MTEPRSMLVIMLRRIGDVLLTTPAVRALRRLFPRARIDFLAEPPADQLLALETSLTETLVYPCAPGLADTVSWLKTIRDRRYDWVIDYLGTPRSALLTFASGAKMRAGPGHVSHTWAYTRRLEQSPAACYSALEKIRVLKSLGLQPDESDFLPALSLPGETLTAGRAALAAVWAGETAAFPTAVEDGSPSPRARSPVPAGEAPAGDAPLIGLVPASRKPTRRWPAASYGALARLLRERVGARALVFWGTGERPLAEAVVAASAGAARLAPATAGLIELAAMLSACRLVVTNCSGPKHIAVARGVPTLTLHGSSDPVCWNPPHPRYRALRRETLFCIGCRLNACPYALECMTGLSPSLVAEEALRLLEATAPAGSGGRTR